MIIRAETKLKYTFYGHSLEFEIMRIESKMANPHVSFHVNTPKHVTYDMLIEFSRFFVSICEFCLPNELTEMRGKEQHYFKDDEKTPTIFRRCCDKFNWVDVSRFAVET